MGPGSPCDPVMVWTGPHPLVPGWHCWSGWVFQHPWPGLSSPEEGSAGGWQRSPQHSLSWCHLKQELQTKQPTPKNLHLLNTGIKTHGTSPARLKSGGQTCCFEIKGFILLGVGQHAALKLMGSFYRGVKKWTASKGWILRGFFNS